MDVVIISSLTLLLFQSEIVHVQPTTAKGIEACCLLPKHESYLPCIDADIVAAGGFSYSVIAGRCVPLWMKYPMVYAKYITCTIHVDVLCLARKKTPSARL